MSEFGKGFSYCLGLFLAHQYMMEDMKPFDGNLWFNGASDHLYDLQIPENFIEKDACEAWRSLVLDYGHGREFLCTHNLTGKDVWWALDKAKEFLLAWDKQWGIEAEKGDYE